MLKKGEKPASAPTGHTVHRSPFTVHEKKPWYREPWLWLLMAGPAAVIVAGTVTIWLAVRSDDGLVADDYYRRGLAINQTLARDRRAAELGLRATVDLTALDSVEVTLSGSDELPPALTLRLVHPTRAGEDRSLALSRVAPGTYRAERLLLPSGRRNAVLEDDSGSWRLSGQWTLPSVRPLELAPRVE